MEEARVLLVDLGTTPGFVTRSRKCLRPVQADPFRPCNEFVDISEGTAPVSALGKITGEFGPNVISSSSLRLP